MPSNRQHVIFGAGPLGRSIAALLAAAGAPARLVTRSGAERLAGVDTVAGDLNDPASAVAAAKGADVIYFCAAPPYRDWPRRFPALQDGAIAAARATGAVLVAAENLYGYGVAGTLTETLPLDATTRKGAVRARMSRRLFEAHAGGEIRAVAGRASDFFGPGVRRSALGERFWPDLIRGRTLNWFGDPDRLHTFTYLPDFAQALITLGAAPDTFGRAWHVPSPQTLTPRQVAGRAARLIGRAEPRFRRTPRILLRMMGLAIPDAGELVELEYSYADDFVMAQDDWLARFGSGGADWDEALLATLDSWRPGSTA